MKLTIDIPSEHTGDVIRFLASLIPSAVVVEAEQTPVDVRPPIQEFDDRQAIVPEVGKRYYTRCGETVLVTGQSEKKFIGTVEISGTQNPYHWNLDGSSPTGYSKLDIVEPTPF